MRHPELRTAGTGGLLVEVADTQAAQHLLAALAADPPAGTVDLVPAACTVLVRFDPTRTTRGAVQRAVLAALAAEPADVSAASDDDAVAIEVCYDGEDLPDVARHTGLSEQEVVARHTAATYRVAFTGFAPGFGYLVGGDPALHVARRSSPRTAVPAGAVGLAGEFTGVYPRASPGGWQLVGRTDAALWDVTREVPALLRPGGLVTFRAVAELGGPPPPPTAPRCLGKGPGLVVRRTGPLALLVDDGRDGHADLGVSPAGSADRASAHAANACVGNPLGTPCLEVLLGGLVVEATTRCVVGLAGAPCDTERNGRRVDGPVVCLDRGDELRLAAPARGLRTYLAARGGFTAPSFLGSASTDTLSGLGPASLAVGDVLPVGGVRAGAVWPQPSSTPLPATPSDAEMTLRVVPGPRDDAFVGGLGGLLSGAWTVGARSDRVGTQLRGEPLQRLDDAQLPSEGVVRGALQVPPDGLPILFGPDRPVTGGYPVIACVVEADLDRSAQLPTGTRVRFVLDDTVLDDTVLDDTVLDDIPRGDA